MRHRSCWLLVGLSACLPLLAASKLEPPDINQYWKVGPFRLRPGFGFQDSGYDSNVQQRREETSDYLATIFGQVDGMMLFAERGFLTFREFVAHTAYDENDELDFTALRGDVRATMVVRRFGLFGELRHVNDTIRPADLQLARPDRRQLEFGVGFVLAPGWRTEIELARRIQRVRYDDQEDILSGGQTISERLDRTEERWDLAFTYRMLDLLSVTFEGYASFPDFENLDASGRTRDSTEYGFLPGLRFAEGGVLEGAARVGWTVIEPDDPTRGDFRELVGNLQLVYRPQRRTSLRFVGRREPSYSVASTSAYILNEVVGLKLTQFFSDVYAVELGARRRRTTFPESALDSDREDLRYDFQAALRFRFSEDVYGQRVELRLHATHSRTDSPVELQDIERTTIGLDGIVGF